MSTSIILGTLWICLICWMLATTLRGTESTQICQGLQIVYKAPLAIRPAVIGMTMSPANAPLYRGRVQMHPAALVLNRLPKETVDLATL